MTRSSSSCARARIHPALLAAAALTLSACGGSGSSPAPQAQDATSSGSVQTFVMTGGDETLQPGVELTPLFHTAPVILDAPGDTDTSDPTASARLPPHTQSVPPDLALLSTRRLTRAVIDAVRAGRPVPEGAVAGRADATTVPTGAVVVTYTPSQIRAAYAMAPLPAAAGPLTDTQAAELGAGQTIYLIDALDDPNLTAELAAFDSAFDLPPCTLTQIPANAPLPLAPASTNGCTLSVVYSTSTGGMTSVAPAYDSNWATEIALDVEWSHATAPLARIVLIEAPNATSLSLRGGIALANALGPGVVSMSFGGAEGAWTTSLDSMFAVGQMSYVAAAGDAGAGVQWPAVSSRVLAVGGSSLTYSEHESRSEVVWSGTGGGVSRFVPTPFYQTSAVPGIGTPVNRAVSDVAFDADPTTGQYIAVMAPGDAGASWLSAGGTSLATPQWAAIIAIANAQRAQASQPPLGAPHALLYGIAARSAAYAYDFDDIIHGSDGTCATCFAGIGYDSPTGVGTPNIGSLLRSLMMSAVPPLSSAPSALVVAQTSIGGTVGIPLSFAVSVPDFDPVTYSLSHAPSGMTINSSGIVTWNAPRVGTYAIAVSARDESTGLTGSGVCTVTIGPLGPVIGATPIIGVAGNPLSGAISFADSTSDTLSVTVSGMPAGMTFVASGMTLQASWASPASGSYMLRVSATDGDGRSASATVPVTITGP